jgi:hypothetical protein
MELKLIAKLLCLSGMTYLLLGASCSSGIYNPAMNVPVNPVQAGDLDINGGKGYLPESSPAHKKDKRLSLAGSGQLTMGLSNSFNLSLKGWHELEQRDTSRFGGILSAHFIRQSEINTTRIYMLHIGVSLLNSENDGTNMHASGIGASVIKHKKYNENFATYTGLSIAYGEQSDLGSDNGAGVGLHFGLAYNIYDNFRINAEITPILQHNWSENSFNFVLSPHISLGYTFNAD